MRAWARRGCIHSMLIAVVSCSEPTTSPEEEPQAAPFGPREGAATPERAPRTGHPEATPETTRDAEDPNTAVRATALRLRDCDLDGTFYFFFGPASAALDTDELDRTLQLSQCLTRTNVRGPIRVIGYGEMDSDAQSGITLALSRAHNVAQRVAMDVVVTEGVIIEAAPPDVLPEDRAPWGRRVEVTIGR